MTSRVDYSLGPGGAFPKERCHRLEAGEVLNLEGRRASKVTADGREEVLLSDVAGHGVQGDLTSSAEAVPGPGWVGFGSWTNEDKDPILLYRGAWIVPPPPEVDAGQAVFLTLGLQPTPNARSMFGAVLQWGSGASGGSDRWGVSCWFQNDSLRTYSSLLGADPGDRIEACVQRAIHNAYGSEWRCTASVAGSRKAETTLPIQAHLEFSWAFAAFEAYSSAFSCEQVPNARETLFESLELRSGENRLAPDWKSTVEFEECGTRVDVVSPAEICIYFR